MEVCEVWAVGPRRRAETYHEAYRRVRATRDAHPAIQPLVDLIAHLGQVLGTTGPEECRNFPDPVPDWLAEKLIAVAHVPPEEVASMRGAQAFERWNDVVSRAKKSERASARKRGCW